MNHLRPPSSLSSQQTDQAQFSVFLPLIVAKAESGPASVIDRFVVLLLSPFSFLPGREALKKTVPFARSVAFAAFDLTPLSPAVLTSTQLSSIVRFLKLRVATNTPQNFHFINFPTLITCSALPFSPSLRDRFFFLK